MADSVTCAFILPQKKRKCRMSVKSGKKFCGEHCAMEADSNDAGDVNKDAARMPCPYDPKHSCYISQLEKHLTKCNSRPKSLPEYIQTDFNFLDSTGGEEELKFSLTSLTNEQLLAIIEKLSKIHNEHVGALPTTIGRHDSLETTLSSLTESRGSYRHVYQNSSILHNMASAGILTAGKNTTYVEFGSGRGQLGYVLGQVIDLEKDSLVMIDRSSPRHKHENRYKVAGQGPESIQRIRADIADVDLARVPLVVQTGRVVGTGKHLCGAATDLALSCLHKANNPAGLVQGVCIALCCHHQCTWRHYVGKNFFQEVDLDARDFAIMKALTSWATCSARPTEEPAQPGRYAALGLDIARREEIGRHCKQIIDRGRVAFVSTFIPARLLCYVEAEISPENVLLIASP